jgi:hypothetical protein
VPRSAPAVELPPETGPYAVARIWTIAGDMVATTDSRDRLSRLRSAGRDPA